MTLHKTQDAMRLAGVTRPTFTHRVKALKLKPEVKWGDSAHYWTDEQIALIANPPAKCPDCKSPYHERCTIADRRDRRDPDRWLLNQRDA